MRAVIQFAAIGSLVTGGFKPGSIPPYNRAVIAVPPLHIHPLPHPPFTLSHSHWARRQCPPSPGCSDETNRKPSLSQPRLSQDPALRARVLFSALDRPMSRIQASTVAGNPRGSSSANLTRTPPSFSSTLMTRQAPSLSTSPCSMLIVCIESS